MGVGNINAGDDGCGVMAVDMLEKKGLKRCFSCGMVPENYLCKVSEMKPELVLIIDAVDFGGNPGEIRYLKGEEVFSGISTHTAGLDLSARFIRESSGAEVAVLGIQPKNTKGLMSEEVKSSVKAIAERISKKLCMNQ